MVYGYIRVSTDKQTVENQRFEVSKFCEKSGISVGKWIEETISGTQDASKRKLGSLLETMQKGDILICSELSRLGRNLLMIMSILNICMEKDVQVWTIKDSYKLGKDISSKVLAFAFGLSAEIERTLISQRTKEALARRKAEGAHIGRPFGSKSKDGKLSGKKERIKKLLQRKIPKAQIAKELGVHPSTLRRFLLEKGGGTFLLYFTTMLDRAQFPVLSQTINGHPLAFLDSSATTQKPLCVIEAMNDFYKNHYSSVKRGAYTLSAKTTQKFEETRLKVAKFIDAPSENSIVFTKGTTESINLVAWSYGLANFEPGDEILLSVLEHHANIVPWQLVAKEKGAKIKVIPCDDNGDLQVAELQNLLCEKTKIVALASIANSIGTINPLAEIIPIIRKFAPKAKILVDAAQGASHSKISVKNLDCDFLAFSGHKIYGPTGVGILYGKPEILENMQPWQGGGEMIDKVFFEGTTFAAPPARFEAGTPPIAEVLGLSAAIDFVNEIGMDNIIAHENKITEYALTALSNVKIIGNPKNRGSIISFIVPNVHPHDVALILDEDGIAVRAGHHCAQPTMARFGIAATLRASFAAYTESWEIDRLCAGLKRAISIMS